MRRPSDAVLLRLVDQGERDRLGHFYLREHGRVTLALRGVRGGSRRFGGDVDLFSRGVATFTPGRNANALASFDVAHAGGLVAADPVRFAIASFWAELVLATTADDDPCESGYDVLAGHLTALATSPESERRDLLLGFQLGWFRALGHLPDLDAASLLEAELPALGPDSETIARALLAGCADVPPLSPVALREIGAVTQRLRERLTSRPLLSVSFLSQMLRGSRSR
ncbi:MAG: recombination protein O N-terminal domain-containing protein [Myxococcales bacterium]|nr:recombination protein O N-terminal domain-containing protein [Myxococcales bacterium]